MSINSDVILFDTYLHAQFCNFWAWLLFKYILKTYSPSIKFTLFFFILSTELVWAKYFAILCSFSSTFNNTFFYFSFSGIKGKNCFRICWKSKRRRIGESICFDQGYLCQQCQWCFWQIWSLSEKEHFYHSKQHSASWRPITFAVFEYFWKNLFYISFIQFIILRRLIISHFAYQFIRFIFKSNQYWTWP